jgi:hypothetical protein
VKKRVRLLNGSEGECQVEMGTTQFHDEATFYARIAMEPGAQEFIILFRIGAYCVICDYGFPNGRENMDTQTVRMLEAAVPEADMLSCSVLRRSSE